MEKLREVLEKTRIEKEEIAKQLEKEKQEKTRREAEQVEEQLLKKRNLEKEIGNIFILI